MKTRKPTQRDFVDLCYKIGFRFYDDGIMRNRDGTKAGFYLKGDALTDAQRAALVAAFGEWIAFYTARPEYAPEIKKAAILLKSRPEMERGGA